MMRARNTGIGPYEQTSNAGYVATHLTKNSFVSGDADVGLQTPAAAACLNHPPSSKHRQNLDDKRPSGHSNDRPVPQGPAQPGVDVRATTPDARKSDKSQSRQSLKQLRAAEARRQFELLQEKRLLQDHLADFWDASLDKKRR